MSHSDASAAGPLPRSTTLGRLRELAALFLKLGTISYGGPAAHIALIEAEIVRKRRWVTQQQFLDMLGAANLIPGPTSTEMAINVGFVRAGWAGLCVAGASFVVPAALITGAFAWAYVRFGSLPQAASALAGIKPAVLAVIAIAIWRLGKTATKDVGLAVLGGLALGAFFVGLNPILILFGGGLAGMLVRRATNLRAAGMLSIPALPRPFSLSLRYLMAVTAASAAAGTVAARPSVGKIALFFLKIGAVLYGGGYVLLAFLEQGLVQQHAWLTRQQLLDAVAIGQFTPGPVLSTATFIGYILGGVPGAAVATVGIFLPSFFYVALLAPVLFRLRQSAWLAAFLDSVNVGAVALMSGVTFRLGVDALRGWPSWVIALASLAVLLRWKMSPAWVVLGGGVAGLLLPILHF
ncbi:MAG TPA: chromate efflux transporter [Candidatus Dormibacteraeota bacterium]|nr:chromate efflux transporter [Candidatus Dormibacteraeota bacterium]